MDNKPKSSEEIAAAYDSQPWWYDLRGFFILTLSYNSTITRQIRFFFSNFGTKHLEVACGTGTLLDLILKYRKWKKLPEVQIEGIDYAQPMLEGAQRRFKNQSNIKLRQADVAHLPYSDNFFDTANIANSIHCFPEVDGALKDIFRVLKPEGTLAVNVLLHPRGIWPFGGIARRINRWGIKKGILYKPYHIEEIKQHYLNNKFEILSESLSGNCYFVLARKPKLDE